MFTRLPADVTPQEVEALRARTIERLQSQGIEDAAELFYEVFPGMRKN
jgi:muconolactone delta-isomerase